MKKRVIALVDMDCFYVQVVQRKNPTLQGKPCAVVQYQTWRGGGIIAVGYEARAFGVTRQMRGDEAKKKCPEIVLVHVPENRGKADLTQFREAGAEVIQVLSTFTDSLERASIDEAYLDLTNVIESQLSSYTAEDVALKTFQMTHIVGLDNKETQLQNEQDIMQCDLYKQWLFTLKMNVHNYHLAIGAIIVDEMRKAVKAKTGFSCSAGVGQNKMLAKIVAGFHKPNQQTLILEEHIEEMFKTTKMRKIRSLGGKLGQQLEDKFKVVFMSELRSLSLKELQSKVGVKSGEVVYWLCRGIDHEPVRVRSLPQSIGCSKNFTGKLKLKTKTDVHTWLSNLCEEVSERLQKDQSQNARVATLFTVGCTNEKKISQSRRCVVCRITHQHVLDEAFRVLLEFNKSSNTEEWSPSLINLSLTASKFQDVYDSKGTKGINSYMKVATNELSSSASSSVTVSSGFHTRIHTSEALNNQDYKNKNSNDTMKNFFQTAHRYNEKRSEKNTAALFSQDGAISTEECSLKESPLSGLFQGSCVRKRRVIEKDDTEKDSINLASVFSCDDDSENNPVNTDKMSVKEHESSQCITKKHDSTYLENICEDNENTINSSSVNDLMNCEKCGKRVLAWELPDHLDFHYAKDVQDSLRKEFLNIYSNTKSNPPKKRKIESSFRKYFSPENK